MTNAWLASDWFHPLPITGEGGERRPLRAGAPTEWRWWPPLRRLQGTRMNIDQNQFKLVIGIVFALLGAGILIVSRGQRGFGQRKQAGVLFLIGSVVFVAVGLGYLDL